MLKGAEDSERIAEFYEYIQDGGVREAFALLVGTFACLKSVSCRTAKQGKVRSFAVSQGDAWCFRSCRHARSCSSIGGRQLLTGIALR